MISDFSSSMNTLSHNKHSIWSKGSLEELLSSSDDDGNTSGSSSGWSLPTQHNVQVKVAFQCT